MKRFLILSDIDGTLINKQREIGAETKRAIERCLELGHRFALATGRMHDAGRIVTQDLPYDGFLISCNGAYAQHLLTGEVLYSKPLNPESVRAITDICHRHGVYYHLYTPHIIVTEHRSMIAQRYADDMKTLAREFRFEVRFVDSKEELDAVAGELVVHKVGFWTADREQMKAITAEIAELGAFATCQSYATSFDVMAPGVSKALAIDALCAHYGIERAAVIAFGDNDNDVDMVRHAGHGVAMGDGSDALRAVADEITATSDEDGIALVLNRLFPGVSGCF